MVLSNKKLKQKLRSLLAESISAAESNIKTPSSSSSSSVVKKEVECIREILGSKPNLPKSQRRRNKKPPPPPSEESKQESKNGNEEENVAKKKRIKKRKREGEENGVSVEKKGEEEEEKKPEKKPKKKKKKPYKKNNKKDDVKEEVNEEEKASEKVAAEEPIKIDESEVKKVYVGGIPYYSTEDDIRSFFEGCGTVTEIDCMRFPETGKFRGIAILTFKTEAAAKRALALDGADMGGFYLKMQPYKAKRIQKPKSDFAPGIMEGYNRIYVGNLSWDITEDDLKMFFSDCKVSGIRFGTDKVTGEFKGYAHVDFSDTVSLSIALKLDQKMVCGRPARISCAVPKKGGGTTKTSENPSKIPDSNKAEDGQSKNADSDKCEYGQSKNLDGNEGEYGQSKYPEENKAEVSQSTGTKKKKRRTCYECGIPGHLSSECPQKKAVGTDGSDVKR
ncbi:protein gar2-like isoform X3 [Iris pallida]|uniref:Protein gar2-like isoform X3 n=2 Tax=Iris pallida TaxID=29817 RepID=A0AAX6I685_IRIPA|nr:protein gar2-like isoform X3 [Iris pallida]